MKFEISLNKVKNKAILFVSIIKFNKLYIYGLW